MNLLHSHRARHNAPKRKVNRRQPSRSQERAARDVTRAPLLASEADGQLKVEDGDLLTVLKTGQAISSEINLAELLKKLLRFALEYAGADKGVLLLEGQGRWTIGAIGWAEHIEATLEQSQQLEETEEVPAEVVRYVARTHKAVILRDAVRSGAFTKAPYIIRHRCKSILCFPLLDQGRLNSMLYLEHTLKMGAFTEDGLALLRQFSAQIAGAIEHARRYHQLEQQVEERTQALKEERAERERAEQALRWQEHFRDTIAHIGRDLRCLAISPAIEAALERAPPETIGKTLAELCFPQGLQTWWYAALQDIFQTGQQCSLTLDLPTPDSPGTYQASLIPVLNKAGSAASLLSIIKDIADLWQAEGRAREAEQFARSVVDALPQQVCVLDETGTIVTANKAWHDFARANPCVSSRAAEGANYLAVCDRATGPEAQGASEFAAGIRTVISGELDEFSMEYPCNTPEKQQWFVGQVTRFPGKSSLYLVVVHEDITEHKWVEQTLREAIDLAEVAQQEAEAAKLEAEKRQQEAERRRQTAESLREVVSILNSNASLEDVLQSLVAKVVLLLGCQAAAIYGYDPESGTVRVQAAIGLAGRDLARVNVPSCTPAVKRSLFPSWPVAIPDLTAVAVSQDEPGLEVQELLLLAPPVEEYRALLAVPILIKEEIYGRLRLYYDAPHEFSEEEVALATLFSDQAALTIENARLREQVKQIAIIDERNRLARDLHDSVTQTIFSASLLAEALPRIWESHPEEGRRGLEELHRLTEGALAEMRTLLLELRPAALIKKPFGELLKQLIQSVASQAQVAATFTGKGDRVLPAEVQVALYRIAQETLNNSIKHAKASQIAVELHYQTEKVILRMSDNGCGFDPSAIPPDHLGVAIMRERAQSIGATFELTSQPGHGTEVLVGHLG